jgi:hypothetical protein
MPFRVLASDSARDSKSSAWLLTDSASSTSEISMTPLKRMRDGGSQLPEGPSPPETDNRCLARVSTLVDVGVRGDCIQNVGRFEPAIHLV